MMLNKEILCNRLREAFGDDSQETVGKKLNMTQGNVSKLLSGSQYPTLETIFHIAEAYNVSVDWLLGISENKRSIKSANAVSYVSVVESLVSLCQHGTAMIADEHSNDMVIKVADPLIKFLVKKGLALSRTDTELYQGWKETKLALFDDKSLIFSGAWFDRDMSFLIGEASTEANWLEVYSKATALEKQYAEMMGEDPGPFGR